jgi:transposase
VPPIHADPGVGPVAALSFMTAIDDPARFKRSRDVAAYFGLTSRRWQSGKSIDVQGRTARRAMLTCGALYEAASALLTRYKRKDKVKSWGLAVAKPRRPPQSCHCGGAQARRDHACDVG